METKPKRKSESRRTLSVPPDFKQRLTPGWAPSACPDPVAAAIIRYLKDRYVSHQISIPALSKTANKATRIGNGRAFPHPDLKVLEKMVGLAIEGSEPFIGQMLSRRFAVVAVFESPKWVTGEGKPAQNRDVDNRIKTMMDAVAKSVVKFVPEANDCNAWQISAFKLHSWEERSTLFIFDLVDRIPRCEATHGKTPEIQQESLRLGRTDSAPQG